MTDAYSVIEEAAKAIIADRTATTIQRLKATGQLLRVTQLRIRDARAQDKLVLRAREAEAKRLTAEAKQTYALALQAKTRADNRQTMLEEKRQRAKAQRYAEKVMAKYGDGLEEKNERIG